MSSSKYEVFLRAVQLKNFTRVTEEMNLTQSGVSHTIASLEEELDVRLLVRSRGGVSLTADGRKMLPLIQTLHNDELHVKELAARLKNLETGIVRVSCFASAEVHWIPQIIKTFREINPSIQVELLHATLNSEIEKMVMDGTADCGFVVLPTMMRLKNWVLYRDPWRVITPSNYACTEEAEFPLDRLSTEPFIFLDEGDDDEIAGILRELNVKPNICHTILRDQTILSMVSNGLGISIMPELMLAQCPYPLRSFELPGDFYRDIAICVKDENYVSPSTMSFIEHTINWTGEYTHF